MFGLILRIPIGDGANKRCRWLPCAPNGVVARDYTGCRASGIRDSPHKVSRIGDTSLFLFRRLLLKPEKEQHSRRILQERYLESAKPVGTCFQYITDPYSASGLFECGKSEREYLDSRIRFDPVSVILPECPIHLFF